VSLRVGFAASLVLAVALAGPALGKTSSRTHGARTWTWSFAADTLGLPPPNTATFGGSWEVTVDSTRANLLGAGTPAAVDTLSADSAAVAAAAAASMAAAQAAAQASAPRVLRQSEVDDGIRYHYIQFKKPVLEDQAASVRFRILAGDIDPTAGLMFQVDAKGRNGYIVRVSGETNQLVVLEPGTWHTLSVERKGSIMTVSYDGTERLKIRDERYTSGSVGLWTEDDTVVDFEQLAVSKR
jgi:hypothetical protein